jgi:tetratricopeptide (TPR) repeat protein
MLGLMLSRRDRVDDAIAACAASRQSDPMSSQARDAEVRALSDADRQAEALQVAQRAVSSGDPAVGDYARLGDVLASLKRYEEAAAAYARALQLIGPNARPEERWPLLLLQASALEEANHWLQTRQLLTQALALAPDEPLILNFLGYAKLERGEDLDSAEAMIRKASALARMMPQSRIRSDGPSTSAAEPRRRSRSSLVPPRVTRRRRRSKSIWETLFTRPVISSRRVTPGPRRW